MTFSDYIISVRGIDFYHLSLKQIPKGTTLENWFSNMFFDWCLLYGDVKIQELNPRITATKGQ